MSSIFDRLAKDHTNTSEKKSSIFDKVRDQSFMDFETPTETIPSKIKRNVARTASDVLELGLGQIGDMKKAFEYISIKPYEMLFGESPKLRKAVQGAGSELPEQERAKLHREMGGFEPPSSGEIREKFTGPIAEKLSGEKDYLEPKNEWERRADDLVKDLVSYSLPGSLPGRILQRIAIPVAGNLAQYAMEEFGSEKDESSMGKLALMIGLDIAGRGNARQFSRDAMQASEQMVAQGTSMSAAPIQNAFNRIRNSNWMQGQQTPSKRPAIRFMEDVENSIVNGQMDVHDAIQFRKDLNEARRNLGGFDIEHPADKAAANAHLDQVAREFIDGFHESYGTINPEFWQANSQANQAFAVTARSNALTNYIGNVIDKHPLLTDATKVLFGYGLATAAKALPVASATAGLGLAAIQGFRVLNRALRSPVIARHYGEVLLNASRHNAKAVGQNLIKIDHLMKKEDEKRKEIKKKYSKP